MKPTIMIVDDRIENLRILEKMLSNSYQIVKCSSGFKALAYLKTANALPHLILLDIIMPDMDGFQVLRALKYHRGLKDIPVICITTGDTEQQALSLGASDYVSKPFDPQVVRLRIENQILLKSHVEDLEVLVEEKVHETIETRDNMLVVLADIIEYRSIESGSHVKRVSRYAEVVVDDLLESSAYADEIGEIGADVIIKSVPMHDVGKIGVPDSVLLKPGKLTAEEFDAMKTHTTIGKTIVDSILSTSKEHSTFLRHCSDIAYCHHERYDGSGYPQGLRGREIPLSARIMAVVDVYDALVTERVYKRAFSHEAAVDIIHRDSGTHFDPVIARSLVRVNENCRQIANQTYASLS